MSSAGSIEIEGTTSEDTAFRGSTFREVSDAVFANPYQRVWGARRRRHRCLSTM